MLADRKYAIEDRQDNKDDRSIFNSCLNDYIDYYGMGIPKRIDEIKWFWQYLEAGPPTNMVTVCCEYWEDCDGIHIPGDTPFKVETGTIRQFNIMEHMHRIAQVAKARELGLDKIVETNSV